MAEVGDDESAPRRESRRADRSIGVIGASCSRRCRRARCGGPTSGCSSSPTCISRRARPSPGAARCCRPTTPPRRCRGWRSLIRALRSARPSSRSATPSTTATARRGCRRATAATLARAAARPRTGSGSPAITIRTRRPASTAMHCDDARARADHLPPRAVGGRVDGEIAGHLHPAARVAGRGKSVRRPLLRRRRHAARPAGLRRLCRRPQRARPRLRRPVRRGTFRAFVLGKDRVYAVARKVLRPADEPDQSCGFAA